MTNRLSRLSITSFLFCTVIAMPFIAGSAIGKEHLLSEFDLEQSLTSAALVMSVRVDEVRPVRVIHGGKGSQTIHQYTFTPTRVLKGVYSRPQLLMTSADLQPYGYNFDPGAIQAGEHRLLILGRSNVGFYGAHRGSTTDLSYPRLNGSADPILAAAEALLAQQELNDRKQLVANIGSDLQQAEGRGAVILLAALARRSDIAAQHTPTISTVASQLRSNDSEVREAAALALAGYFETDYLEDPSNREIAVTELIASLENQIPRLSPRVATLQALALAPDSVRTNNEATDLLSLLTPSETNAEFTARLDIFGGVHEGQAGEAAESIAQMIGELPLDESHSVQRSATRALARVANEDGTAQLLERLQRKKLLGLESVPEILAIGSLFEHVADTWSIQKPLTEMDLTHAEQVAFLRASADSPTPELVPTLSNMLDPRYPQLRRLAADLLMRIDSEEAALVLQPHLAEETNLGYKLRVSAFLGRHGIDDGYVYAVEHMSDPRYRDAAVNAIAAIDRPETAEQMLEVYRSSNDVGWRQAAIRALGLLRHAPFRDELRTLTTNLGHPLAPAALQARADLGDTQVGNVLPDAMSSRSELLVVAAARAAESLFLQDTVRSSGTRRELTGLLAGLAVNRDMSPDVREAALDALEAADDSELDEVLISMVNDRGLERTSLIGHVQDLLRERSINVWGDVSVAYQSE
jgi:HEAT repeat protein